MGSKYLFVCSKCEYKAEVSGGSDAGFMVKTQTMLCKDCKELVDVTFGYHDHVEERYKDDNIPVGACSLCKGSNVSEWNDPSSCPKCNGKMIKENLTICWD